MSQLLYQQQQLSDWHKWGLMALQLKNVLYQKMPQLFAEHRQVAHTPDTTGSEETYTTVLWYSTFIKTLLHVGNYHISFPCASVLIISDLFCPPCV
jgi:hypothetical protein